VYGKIFDSMYDGTLFGHWEAIVTMQQLIVLADPAGIVDMTIDAISARTSIPAHILAKGISVLEADDPYSRTAGNDGRRISRMDTHRPWGWRLVNYEKYRDIKSNEDRRSKWREDKRRQRAAEQLKPDVSTNVHQCPPMSTHADADADVDKGICPSDSLELEKITIPLKNGSDDFKVTSEYLVELAKAFPGVDIHQEMREIREWNLSNPTRRKTKAGIRRHIAAWMSNEQQRIDDSKPEDEYALN